MRIIDLSDSKLLELIDNRKGDSATLWSTIKKIYEKNTAIYDSNPDWFKDIPNNQPKPTLARVFTNTEAVINSLISNPPKPNIIPNREDETATKTAQGQEKYFVQKYNDLNVKEVFRASLRDLYFCRLLCVKPYWDSKLDDFNAKRIDPRKVRFSTCANKEQDSEFAIEDVESTLWELITKYPKMKKDILEASGLKTEADALVKNPKVEYEECWIGNYLVIRYKAKILWKGKNPYWDWDGILATKDEMNELLDDTKSPKETIKRLQGATEAVEGSEDVISTQEKRRSEQEAKKQAMIESGGEDDELPYEAYLFNHFDTPRKPYIFATVLKNEDGPIGRTSFIETAAPLAEDADKTKMQIHRNMKVVNGITKVDSSVMTKEKAQVLRYDTGGVIWGKGVISGVQREFGNGLPAFVFQNLEQTLNEIDNIMASTSAFRGEREGQETKGGRMALIEQSFLRLNEMVQVVDFVSKELFDWWFQLAKVRYTERHYAKFMGPKEALETIEFTQQDFEKGTQVRIIPGKTLPEDRAFKFQRAQEDVKNGIISPIQYFKDGGYENPVQVAQEAYLFSKDPAQVLGLPSEQVPTTVPSPQPSQEVPSMAPPEQAPMDQNMQPMA